MPSLVDQVLEQGRTQPSSFNGADYYFKGREQAREERSSLVDNQLKQQRIEQQDVLFPIQQRAEEMQNQLTGLKLQQNMRSWENTVGNEAALNELQGTVNDVIANEDVLDPASYLDIGSVLQRNPRLREDPRASAVLNDFAASRSVAQHLEQVKQQVLGKETVAATQAGARVDVAGINAGSRENVAQMKADEAAVHEDRVDARITMRQEAKGKSLAQYLDEQVPKLMKGDPAHLVTGLSPTESVKLATQTWQQINSAGTATTQPAPVTTPSGPVKPTSKEEFDSLPKGALYINPADGKTYRKK